LYFGSLPSPLPRGRLPRGCEPGAGAQRGPQPGAARKSALNLARADRSLKVSLKGKREYAGWDDAFTAMLIPG
jgi:hypothetical protein